MAVYFIRAGSTPYVKIGFAADPARRLRSLQGGNHERLKILRVIEGGEAVERRLHWHFAMHRYSGEWFILTDEQVHGEFGPGASLAAPTIDREALRQEVERYLAAHSLAPTTFGLLAANDSELVWKLRGQYNCLCSPRKAARVRDFLDLHPNGPPAFRRGIVLTSDAMPA